MGNSRAQKVAQLLKKEIACIIQEELKDPRVGLVTLTRIEVAKDLKSARIYFSCFGGQSKKDEVSKGLAHSTGFIKKLIGERLRLRFTPELTFILDRSVEESIRLSETIDRVIEHDTHKRDSQDNNSP